MTSIEEFHSALDTYIAKYRRDDVPKLSIGPLYDLRPEDATTEGPHWPNEWPNNALAGVYAIFTENKELLYVGKSSMNSFLGARLGTYFGYAKYRSCRIKHLSWTQTPRYVLTIGVSNCMVFEAPALEEYLIFQTHPLDNKAGRSSGI